MSSLKDKIKNAINTVNDIIDKIDKVDPSEIQDKEFILTKLEDIKKFLKILGRVSDIEPLAQVLTVPPNNSLSTYMDNFVFNQIHILLTTLDQPMYYNNQQNIIDTVHTVYVSLYKVIKTFRFDLDKKAVDEMISDLLNYEQKLKSYEDELEKLQEQFKKQIDDIESLKKTIKEDFEALKKSTVKTTKEIIQHAQRVLEWTTASGLHDAYAKRANEMQKIVNRLYWIFIISAFVGIPVLYIVIFAPYAPLQFLGISTKPLIHFMNSEPGILMVLARLGFVIPFILFLWLLWQNYNRHRLLLEEYKLKSMLAQNMIMIKKVVDEEEDELILSF